MSPPRRSAAGQPRRVSGTRLTRKYVEPEIDHAPDLGDIVLYQDHNWDVVGYDYAGPQDGEHQPRMLGLVRVEHRAGLPAKRHRARVDARAVRVVGQQLLLPDLPPPIPTEREIQR